VVKEHDGKCARCRQKIKPKRHAIFWSGMYGADFGVYCPLCWEISMSAWVLTQDDREQTLEVVDYMIKLVREEVGYVLP